jgi:SAM-dependent methyltransferase
MMRFAIALAFANVVGEPNMSWEKWRQKQELMKQDLGITDSRLQIWNAEEKYLLAHTGGEPSLNVGAGNSTIPAGVSCDPLVPRDVICVAEHLPFRAGVFRSVMFFSVLDHLNDDLKCLWEARRTLAANGRILVMQSMIEKPIKFRLRRTTSFLVHRKIHRLFADPESLLCLPSWDKNHMRNYNSRRLKALFRKVGMEIVDFTTQEVAQMPMVFASYVRRH